MSELQNLRILSIDSAQQIAQFYKTIEIYGLSMNFFGLNHFRRYGRTPKPCPSSRFLKLIIFPRFIATSELEILQQHGRIGWDTHALHGSSSIGGLIMELCHVPC